LPDDQKEDAIAGLPDDQKEDALVKLFLGLRSVAQDYMRRRKSKKGL